MFPCKFPLADGQKFSFHSAQARSIYSPLSRHLSKHLYKRVTHTCCVSSYASKGGGGDYHLVSVTPSVNGPNVTLNSDNSHRSMGEMGKRYVRIRSSV